MKLTPGRVWNTETQTAVNALYERKLSNYSRPRTTQPVKEFPVTAVGKIDFKELEKMAEKED